jgi:hypothetical protein
MKRIIALLSALLLLIGNIGFLHTSATEVRRDENANSTSTITEATLSRGFAISSLEYSEADFTLDFAVVGIPQNINSVTIGIERRTPDSQMVGSFPILVRQFQTATDRISSRLNIGALDEKYDYVFVVIAGNQKAEQKIVTSGRNVSLLAHANSDSGEDFFYVFFSGMWEYGETPRRVSGEFLQEVPPGGAAIPPTVARDGWLFNGWEGDYSNITEDTVIEAKWLRLGAVSTDGEGNISSADIVYLARHIAGHAGFEIEDYRLANLWGEDRPPVPDDISMLAKLAVGHDWAELTAPTDMPTIEVITQIPTGLTHLHGMDIEYIATPSERGYIREVRRDSTTVYHSGTGPPSKPHSINRPEQIGTLGQARLSFAYEDKVSPITFTVEDSNGLTATYVIENPPYRSRPEDFSFDFYCDMPEEIWVDSLYGNLPIATNRLLVSLIRPVETREEMNEILQAIASIQGEAIYYSGHTLIDIYVPPMDEYGLYYLGEQLLADYPHLFDDHYTMSKMPPIVPDIESTGSIREGGGFFDSGVTTGSSFRTRNNYWWDTGDAWALRAVDMPRAWAVFGAQVREGKTKVGIIDDGVNHNHPYLQLLPGNMLRHRRSTGNGSHGTPVMGIIGGAHNNGHVVGAINISEQNLYSYNSFIINNDSHFTDAILVGLGTLVKEKNVRVVNASFGSRNKMDPFETKSFGRTVPSNSKYNTEMNKLLTPSRNPEDEIPKFLIVQSGGNNAFNAYYKGAFSLVTEPHLRDIIITVGNSTESGEIAESSNYNVDVLAPGTDISTTSVCGNITFKNGTSYSAPFVTALAALIFEEKPDLTPEQVKQIIISTAKSHGRAITEHRGQAISEEYRNHTYYEINATAALLKASGHNPNVYLGNPRINSNPSQSIMVGHVICDDTGENIVGATAKLYRGDKEEQTTTTTDYGFYRIFGIPPVAGLGGMRIVVEAEGYLPYEINHSQINRGINEYTHRLKLADSITISGRVQFSNTAVTPLGATVTLIDSNGKRLQTERPNPFNGEYSFIVTSPFARSYTIEVYAPRYISQSRTILRNEIPSPHIENMDFMLMSQLQPGVWTLCQTPDEDILWDAIAYGGGRFVAFGAMRGQRQLHMMTSTDGIHWQSLSPVPLSFSPSIWASEAGVFLTYDESQNRFVGGASNSSRTRLVYSYDGTTWNMIPEFIRQDYVIHHDIAVGNGKIVVMGETNIMGEDRPKTVLVIDASKDLKDLRNWEEADKIPLQFVDGEETLPRAWKNIAFGNGVFVAGSNSHYRSAQNPDAPSPRIFTMTSVDGKTWHLGQTSVLETISVIAFGNGIFVARQSSWINTVITSTDAQTWHSLTVVGATGISDVAHVRDGVFIAVGSGQTVVFSPQRNERETLPAPTPLRRWNRVAASDCGSIAVAVSVSGTQNQRAMVIEFSQHHD